MSKYIIDIPEDAKYGILTCEVGRGYYTKDIDLAETEQLTADYINEHFGSLQDDAYQKGFEDGVTKRTDGDACTGCKYKGNPNDNPCKCCSNGYPNQWTAKDDKIEVGDEVIYNGTTKCIVVRSEDDERYASLFDSDGTHYFADHCECKKTGRHFDIASILEAMRHD